jgi:nucleoside 2-deoxyribosyltransferase
MAKKIFVGGAIQYALEDDGFNENLRKLLEKTMDQLEADGYEVLSAHRYENYGEMDVNDRQEWVTQRDYAWMQECDAYVAVLPQGPDGRPVRTDGSHVELGWASAMGKKIILLETQAANVEYSFLVAGLQGIADVTHVDIGEIHNPCFKLANVIEDEVSKQVMHQHAPPPPPPLPKRNFG